MKLDLVLNQTRRLLNMKKSGVTPETSKKKTKCTSEALATCYQQESSQNMNAGQLVSVS